MTAFADTLNGKTALRIDSAVTTPGDDDDGGSTWYSQDKTGTYVHKILSGEGTNGVTINFITPLEVPPAGDQLRRRVHHPRDARDLDDYRADAGHLYRQRLIYGTYAVPDSKAFKLPDGRMTHTFQISLDLRVRVLRQGARWQRFFVPRARDGQTYWLAKYMGPLEFAEDLGGRFTIKGENRDAFIQGHMAATGASLIPERPSVKNGVYTVNGTQFDDLITVTGGTASWYVQFNGMSESVNVGTSTPLNVFGHGGSDIIRVEIGRGAYVDAGAGNDNVSGGFYPDTFTGGAGKDRLFGHGGDDRLAGNGGHDSSSAGRATTASTAATKTTRWKAATASTACGAAAATTSRRQRLQRQVIRRSRPRHPQRREPERPARRRPGSDQLFGGAGTDAFMLADKHPTSPTAERRPTWSPPPIRTTCSQTSIRGDGRIPVVATPASRFCAAERICRWRDRDVGVATTERLPLHFFVSNTSRYGTAFRPPLSSEVSEVLAVEPDGVAAAGLKLHRRDAGALVVEVVRLPASGKFPCASFDHDQLPAACLAEVTGFRWWRGRR